MKAESQRTYEQFVHELLDSKFDPIRKKVALAGVKDTQFEMLTIQTKPTDEEKPAILEWATLRERFARQEDEIEARYQSAFRTVNSMYVTAGLATTADLYNGFLTYADFNKKRKDLFAILMQQTDNIRAALQQQNMEARTRAASVAQEAMRQNLLQQQINVQQQQVNAQRLQNIAPVPRMITCQHVGQFTYCN